MSLSFEDLARRYNFRNTTSRRAMFTELVIRELDARVKPRRVLDIGCGRGIGMESHWTRAIRGHVEDFWGIEPNPEVTPEEGIFDQFQHRLMETAELPVDSFDVAYSHMVMEHVADPEAFLRAVHQCLKPGGRYYFITPNSRHYFSVITRLLKRMHLDEQVLRLVKGRQKVEDYHYPVQYRCNAPAVINRFATPIGFEPPEYVFAEPTGPDGYLRGPLRPVLHVMNLKRNLIRRPACLLNVIARLTKPKAPTD